MGGQDCKQRYFSRWPSSEGYYLEVDLEYPKRVMRITQ